MKRITLSAIFLCSFAYFSNAQFGGFLQKVKDKTEDKASDKAANDIVNGSSNQNNNQQNQNNNQNQQNNSGSQNNNNTTTTTTAASTPDDPTAGYKTYSNYDFVPGDTVIFEDHFADDQDGEFPSHWSLEAGQGILNMVGKDESFALTQGNYVRVAPRLKSPSYLGNAFTVEFDYFSNPGYGVILFLQDAKQGRYNLHFENNGEVSSGYFSKDFSSPYPDQSAKFQGKWHHAAMIYKNGQIKCYVDQYRVLVMPGVIETFASVQFGGIGDATNPIIFKDIRVAEGGNMNMIGKKFTDAKIITHGINFDIDKATIKPESMGTLNMIVKVLNNNPDLKFEVDGHTDNTGTAAHNLTLSQQRADAVKTQLVSMGIDAGRLTTKGFGDTKPISDNSSPEGQANNRRVEFVRQ